MLTAMTQEQISVVRSRLDEYIHKGQSRALAVQERILREVPMDVIAPSGRLAFVADADGISANVLRGTADLVETERFGIHAHALRQVSEIANVPDKYADHLLKTGWGRDLLARNLSDGVRLGNPKARYLVRRVGDQVRGVMSNKFRRIDARPVLDVCIGEAQKVGAIVVDGTASDVRVEMKFIVPRILEPAPGEYMVFGFAWSNSNYGSGANSFRAFAFRLVCFNGATLEQALRQVHLGRALTEDVEWSDQTLRLDTATAVSAARDTVRNLLSEAKIGATAGLITAAAGEGVDAKAALALLAKKLTKGESAKIAEAFNSPDVVALPAGNTTWRFSNAISLVARDTEDADRKLDLERLAGDVLKR